MVLYDMDEQLASFQNIKSLTMKRILQSYSQIKTIPMLSKLLSKNKVNITLELIDLYLLLMVIAMGCEFINLVVLMNRLL
jgi:hypothetical protein